MRSLSSVYKNRSFVTNNEKVQIPDVDFPETPVPAATDNENENAAQQPETDAAAEELAGADAENTNASEEETSPRQETEETAQQPAVQPWQIPRMEPPAPPPVTKETIGEFYSEELRQLAEDVAQQAYYDALNKKKAELRECVSSVQQAMNDLVSAQQRFMADYTDELKYMAVDIAEKMIYEKIEEDDQILTRMVMQSVAVVKNADWLNVEVSERLVGLIDQINKELEKPEYEGKAHVFPIAGTDGVCRVVTNEGAVVSSIEVQANNLRRAFRELDQQDAARMNENGTRK